MKAYRPPRKLLAEVDALLKAKPSRQHDPLEETIEVLCQGRHYTWMGIYLVADRSQQDVVNNAPAKIAAAKTPAKILISIKLGSKQLGMLAVESAREPAFSREDRVLLETVAKRLARFLSGPGKYIARRARQNAA